MKPIVIALVGNPNCGKTTLFNRLTGKQQEVGNWSGVTVEKKKGYFSVEDQVIEVIDLPGCYHYSSNNTENAIDERITHQYLASREAALIINIVDATNLERHLYLTVQLLEQDTPVIVVLNMMDAASKQNISIDNTILAKQLGCPVIPIIAVKGVGIIDLKQAILHYCKPPSTEIKTLKL